MNGRTGVISIVVGLQRAYHRIKQNKIH